MAACRSKQHQKAVEDLRAELEEEEDILDDSSFQQAAASSDEQAEQPEPEDEAPSSPEPTCKAFAAFHIEADKKFGMHYRQLLLWILVAPPVVTDAGSIVKLSLS